MRRSDLFRRLWNASGYFLFAAFVAVFLILNFARHAAFHTHALDLGYYDQALWNTAHGRWFENSLKPFPLLGSHFSPLLAVVAPLYWIWSDVRVTFVVQILALALSGLPLYLLTRERWPAAAPLVLLAYYLNPSLHVAALNQLRGTVLALPCLALALYGLIKQDRRWLVLGAILALLSKEDMSIFVAAFGLFWLIKTRDWKLGGALIAAGAAWFFIVPFKVVPAFRGEGYPYFNKYPYLGSGPGEAIQTLLRDPLVLLRVIATPDRLTAVWRVTWPGGLLGLFSPGLMALSLPGFGYLLASTNGIIYTLQDWYPAPLQPILYFAALMGLLWLKERNWGRGWVARLAVVYLVLVGALAFWQLSPVPPARSADPAHFRVTDHARLGHDLLARIPPDAPISAQSDLLPHLAHRQEIHVYPDNLDRVDYVLVDLTSNPYPFPNAEELNHSLQNLLADTAFEIWVEADGYTILRRAGELSIQHPRREVLDGQIALLGFDLAAADERGEFQPLAEPASLKPGQNVRLTLHWEGLADVEEEFAVFVHLVGPDGRVIGQHDGLPANGYRATSWWEAGWQVRDLHYFQVDPAAPAGPARLRVGMYSPYTARRLLTAGGRDAIDLGDIQIIP